MTPRTLKDAVKAREKRMLSARKATIASGHYSMSCGCRQVDEFRVIEERMETDILINLLRAASKSSKTRKGKK